MYCGTSLNVELMDISQIEHSVDKGGNENQDKEKNTPLTNCKFNLAIACKDCNMKYKKQVTKVDLSGHFKAGCKKECTKPCEDYISLREEYISANSIILQPQGVEKNSEKYTVTYNPMRDLYTPKSDDDNAIIFIQQHIMRFHLNSEKRSHDILDICADIVELNEMGVNSVGNILNYISKKRHINVIGNIFVSELKDKFMNKSLEELLDYCKTIVLCSVWI